MDDVEGGAKAALEMVSNPTRGLREGAHILSVLLAKLPRSDNETASDYLGDSWKPFYCLRNSSL